MPVPWQEHHASVEEIIFYEGKQKVNLLPAGML